MASRGGAFTGIKRVFSPGMPSIPTSGSRAHTILTLPGATQYSVLQSLRYQLNPNLSSDVLSGKDDAAVILATPRYAAWLTEESFMAGLISTLRSTRFDVAGPDPPKFHVLAAVVDGLPSADGSRKTQHGLSLRFGSVAKMLPGLWDEGAEAASATRSEPEPSYLSVSMGSQDDMTTVVPLANTLFQNGRRSTLLASEWNPLKRGPEQKRVTYMPLRMVEKRSQTIDLTQSSPKDRLRIRSPLVPITHHRMVLEVLGNILAKIEINGQPSPASKELQENVFRWLDARKSQLPSQEAAGPVGVWALVIPRALTGLADQPLNAPKWVVETALAKFLNSMSPRHGRSTTDKLPRLLAFEILKHAELSAWNTSPYMHSALAGGARLHKILSGGGEWGAKASLLSLDPKTSYVQESEEAELERFQKSFHGDSSGDDAIAKPGDYVQFFVEGDPSGGITAAAPGNRLRPVSGKYPSLSFGVGYPGMGEEEHVLPEEYQTPLAQKWQCLPRNDHFGAVSAEGLYLKSALGTQSKLDVPGSTAAVF